MNQAFVALAIDWIALFEPQIKQRLRALYKRCQPSLKMTDVFVVRESKWRQYVAAKMQEDKACEQEALASCQEIEPQSLLLAPQNIFRYLVPEKFLYNTSSKYVIVTDAEAGVLEVSHDGVQSERILSLPLARFFDLLSSRKLISFADVLSFCFDISGFDEEIHSTKINNLLARARKVCGDALLIRSQQCWIHVDIKKDVHFERRLQRPPLFVQRQSVTQPKADRLRNETSLSLLLAKARDLNGKSVSRKELQEIMGVPKSTLTRHLLTWQKRGWVERYGRGSAVTYRLTFVDS